MSQENKNEMIQVKDLSFRYEEGFIIRNASLTVGAGEFIGITGPNGTGKTTLVKLLLSILRPDAGEILFQREHVNISYVSQKAVAFNQSFPASVEEVAALGLYGKEKSRLRPFSPRRETAARKEKVTRALEMVGMESYRHRLMGKLSGGQQQRVFLAKALAAGPDIIFLDEPTAGIDHDTAGSICCLLGELNKKLGITILMVTHDVASIIHHAHKVFYFHKGGAIETIPAENFGEAFQNAMQ